MNLSIIIPFHRGVHFLEDCFQSIRDQRLSSFEIILVLDHVQEEISNLISKYKDLNLVIIELKETKLLYYIQNDMNPELEPEGYSGVAAARNAGLEVTQGEYVYFLDSDDYILDDTLPRLLQEVEGKNVDFAYGKRNTTWFSRRVYLTSVAEKDEEAQDTEEDEQDIGDQEQYDEKAISHEMNEDSDIKVVLTRRQRSILKVQEKLSEINHMNSESLTLLAEAYYTLFISRKGFRNVSVLGILFRKSFLKESKIRFNEDEIYFSDINFIIQVLQHINICSYVEDAIYIKRNHNDPIHYPSVLQTKAEDTFEEYLQVFQRALENTQKDALLRSCLEDKLITYYAGTYAPRLRRSENDVWRNEFFHAISEMMHKVNQDKIKRLKGYKKRVVKALLKGKVKRAIFAVTRYLGFKKLKKIKKNSKILGHYLYHNFFTKFKIKNNLVLCESFFGKSYSDSPKYIYEYLNRNYPGKYHFVWVVNQKSEIPYHPIKVKRFSIRYCYYLARCKYFVFNGRQPEWFRKREDTVFLETWHGTPLKKLVFDMDEVMSSSPLYKAQFYNQSRSWDYLVAANKFSSETFRRAFLFDKEMLEHGYPRNDILHSPDQDKVVAKIKKKLKIPAGKKTILYAPTWRDDEYYGPGEYKFAMKLDLALIKQELGEDYIILLRTHYFIADAIDVTGLEGFTYNVSKYDDISELYLISDILITDYSSVFFDYANLKRPILFYTYDLDKYRDMLRGFYMDIENEVPGPLLFTNEEVIEAIRNIEDITAKYKERYDIFYERFCNLEDGHASENIAKCVFNLS